MPRMGMMLIKTPPFPQRRMVRPNFKIAQRLGHPSLIDFIGDSVAILWKEWPMDMKVTALNAQNVFSFNGICPHPACRRDSVFIQATGVHSERIGTTERGNDIHRMAVVLQ